MSKNGTGAGRTAWRVLRGALAAAFAALPMAAPGATETWKDTSTSGYWSDASENRWYRFDDGWDVRRPDLAVGQWNYDGTKSANVITFANGVQSSMTVNGLGGAEYLVNQLWFSNSTSRTFAQADGSYLKMSGGSAKIEAASGSGTGTYTFGVPLLLDATTELNPVGGALTFNAAVTNGGYWINVYGANQKTLTLGGVLSGSGGLAVKQDSLVLLTNNNTFSGAIWVEKGTVQLANHTNAIGSSGIVNVGTNATLDLQYGTVDVRPAALNLYGTGTNSTWGALRKATSGTTTWRGIVTLGADSRIVASAGNIYFATNVAAGSSTLYVTNANAMNMTGGEMTGTKTTGDGALYKTGAGSFQLRPGSGLTGTISLQQGEIRQSTGNSSVLPSGGLLILADGTTYRSDGTTVREMAKASRIDGNVTLGYSGGGRVTFSGDMNLAAGQRTLTAANDVTISGAVTNGGLTKAGTGTMILLGANTYALGTLISAGVLQVGSNGTAGSVSGNITNNSALAFYRSDSSTFSGAISGTGALTNLAGTLTLSGTSTYSGGTTVAGGTLLVSGSIGSSAVSVNSGATLAGAGTVGSIASLSGTVSPGASAGVAGTLTASGAAALGGGTYTCDITGTGSTDCDKIAAGGAVAAASALTINLPASAPAGFSEASSYSWTIMSGSSVDTANMSIGTKWTTGGTLALSTSGNTIVVTHTPGAPSAPTGLSASDGTSTAQVALSWNDGSGETGYVIWRNTVNTFASSTAIYTNAAGVVTYNDSAATAGQLYYYWVTATNASGSSSASTSDSGYKRLTAPANLAAADGGSTANITVTWDAATGASSYHLYRDTDSTPAGATELGPQSSGYADTSATAGQLYYYWVVASNSTSSSTSDWSTANSGYMKLTAPGSVAATENQSDRVTVTWGNVAGETGFGIWRYTSDVSGSATCIGAVGADTLTYDDTTGDAGTTYYYWVRATNSTSASMSDFGASDSGMKTLTEPSTAASSITFGSLAPDSYTVGWTRGNGEYVLVVAKQGSAPTDPADSTVYAANAAFGSGDTTAAGSYVVYKGTGTSVPVTGLSAGTEYYFAVYEFNGAATPNYRTSDEPVSSQYTLVAEPTTQATGIAITGTNEVTLTGINWTDGNGASRIVVVKAGSAVDGFPADGTGYTANATFGSGSQIGTGNYVVHAGSGPLATLSGLSRDVVYHFRVFEFNGSGSTANYLTNAASGNPASSTTMAANPASAAADLAISSIGTTSFTVTWTKGTAGTNTLILVRAGTLSTEPSDLATYAASAVFGSGSEIGTGGYVVYTNTGASVTVTGLAPGTRYYVKAYAFNGAANSQNYRTSDEPTIDDYTLMTEPSQATGISFGTLADTSYAVSYTAGDGLSRLVVAKAGSAVDWTPTDGTAYAGENNAFGSGTELSAGNFLVHRGAGPFTLSGLSAATDYHLRIFEYQGTNDTLNYNVSAASGNPSNRYTLSAEPTAHGTLTATAVSDTEIDLDWGDATGESGFLIVRQTSDSGWTAPADGTAYTAGNSLGGGTVVYAGTAAGAGSTTDSSLSANTTYYYRIYPYAYDGTAAHATYNYYTGGTPGSANATTGESEPGSSLTLSSFAPASGTSATITWTGSGADGTIILVKSGGAVDSNPVDWTGYTANAAFTSGDQIGTGNYVVYAAAGSTGIVTVTGLSAGTTYYAALYPYNGSGTFLNYRTTSPATGSATVLPDPTAVSATADGKTLMNLAWTKNASYDVMIVHKTGSAPAAPTQGASYSVGGACGGGTVIYKGSGAALEHVVASGTAHYYAFYSYSGNYYSAGAADSESTTSFASGEIAETFSYTNSTALTGLNGETGWGGAWYGDTAVFTNSDGSFTTQTNYPATAGNKLWVSPVNDANVAVYRPLGQSYNNGRLYFGYLLNYAYSGSEKYEGLSFYASNTSEKLFFGEIGGSDQILGIDSTASSYTLSAGGGNDYIIVGYYDWAAGEAKAKAYKIGTQAVPTDEPASWDVTVSKASNTVGAVDTIRLAAGEYGGASGTPGDTYFDEVRIATNWSGLLGVVPSKPADPTNQTATADGSEMVRLAWTQNGSANSVLVLHNTGSIGTNPTDGVSYNVGDTIGGSKVVYKGSATKLEHVVEDGASAYYKFYSYNGANYYSTGVAANVSMAAYGNYEKVNPFSYTNGAALGSSQVGGQGFGANYWSVDSGTWTVQTNYATAAVDSVPKFLDMSNYPSMAGNLAYCSDPGNGANAKAQRSLETAVSTGTFYVAFMMSYQYRGANKWAGLSLLNSGGTEKAFFGKGAGANWSTLGVGDGSTTYFSAYDMGQYYSSDGYGSTANVYLVVGKYDFSSQQLAAKAYRVVDGYTFPESEPSWDVSTTLGTGIDSIGRIQLNAGSTDAGGSIGKVFIDEIRYATNWSGLLSLTCPTWAGSNTLSNTSTWLGDTEHFVFQSSPVGLGQSAAVEFDWAQTGAFAATNAMAWLQNANSNSYWSNQVQMTTAGIITSRFAAAGSGCAAVRTNNPAITVQNLNPPTGATAAQDGVNTNSQINLSWTRGISGLAKDTIVVRQTVDSGWTAPVNGTTYNAGDSLGSGTVVYRGAGTSASDTGLAPSTTYYYRFYAENYTYYSATYDSDSAATAAGGQNIVIDGSSADWFGSAPAVLDSSASSLQEYIWTDKRGEMRPENADHPNGDIQEFRVFADSTWVYFLVRMTNIADATKPFVAIGVDTRTNASSTAMNWLGDDSGAYIGDGYAQGGAAHYPAKQLNIHHVSAVGGARIEVYSHDGAAWYAPPTGGNTNVAISADNDVIELKVARADLDLSGAVTGRFTVASYVNTGSWNNDGDGTTHLADNTADLLDTLSIPPWNTADNSANLSAWLEDISDADVDFWVDVKFAASGVSDNSKPSAPALSSPTNTAATTASPNLSWQSSSDPDGQVTGYLLEISTNEQFNGVTGTENGTVSLRIHLPASTTNYTFTTSATQYWWRVRARDTAGELSAATTRYFRVVGKLDTEGPQPTLLYIGTNVAGYLAGDYDAQIAQYGPIQSVMDSELRDTNNVFGFVLQWDDASGVYATNHMRSTDSPPEAGGFAFNIVSDQGRVSPNWDIVEYTNGVFSREWGIDVPFYATNTLAAGNDNPRITNYVIAAFSMTNYDPNVDYYLTVSAEDSYTTDGSWWTYGSWTSFTNASGGKYFSGWCEDGPNTARNITTNLLIQIDVTDDDIVAPRASTNQGWANESSLVVSNASGALEYVEGTGQDVLRQVTDGNLIGGPLYFHFNAYDSYYQGVALGTNPTFTANGRTLTNSAFVAAYWQTNWANYSPSLSSTDDTCNADTVLAWSWATITTQDVTALWGPDSLSGEMGVTNLIQMDLYDVDNDRSGDQASARVNFGRIRLVDDDAVDPVIVAGDTNPAVTGTGLAREYVLTNLVEWTFPSGADDGTPAPTTVADNMSASDISHGPAGALQGTTNIYMNAQFYKPATNRYVTFTLTPAAGKTFKAESIGYETRVSSLNGPDTIELYGTLPGGSETLWATNTINLYDIDNSGTNWNNYLVISSGVSMAMSAASTGTVSFKLLARVTDTNHLVSEDNANWYLDNLTVSGYILGEGGGAQVTDHDLAKGTAKFSLSAYDNYSGIDGTIGSPTGRAPRVDFWNVSQGVCPVTNAFVTNGWTSATGTTALGITGYAPAVGDKKQIALGSGGASLTYYARFTVNDHDVDRSGDSRVVTNMTTNTVYDNDSSRPARGYLYGGPLGVFVDGSLTKSVSSGNSKEYRINDEQLQSASSTSIAVKVNLYDYSGWTVPTLIFSNATAGVMSTSWLTSVHTDDVNTTNRPDSAMEWLFAKSQADTLFSSYEGITNEFRIASVWDKDDDRLDSGDNNVDNLELTNARIGYVTFIDNDVGMPNVQSNYSETRTNWTVPKVYLGLPGDASRSNLYTGGLPADTGESAVLANLTNRVYDSQLAEVSAAAPLSVVLPVFDTGGGGSGRTIKGVQRGTSATEASTNGGAHAVTNSWINIGTVQVQNVSSYRSDLSSSLALTKIAAQYPTSTWAFTAFSYDQVGQWLPAAAVSSNHAMSAGLFDADDNRPNDQRTREVALGNLLVLDNDTVAPVAPTNLTVNGIPATTTWDRATAPWTNQPQFRVGFEPAVDGEPAGTDLEKTGIGEHRTATTTTNIGPDLGTPLAVPSENSLANYGFESSSNNWTLSGAEVSTEQAYEGTHSVKMLGSTAQQTVYLYNTNGYAPRVAVVGAQYRGTGTVTLAIAGLDTNGAPVGGSSFDVQIVGTAGQWEGATATSNTLAATVDRVQVTLTSGANTYWDDIRVQIELLDAGVPVDAVATLFTATEQGLRTNYLFAVDRDNNRAGDRKASSAPADPYIPSFGTAYDITKPTEVPVSEASTENVADPTTQFDILWNPASVGPDDEDDANYPAGYSGADVLSPWRSYKIYYGTFNPNLVPGGDPGPGNASAYIYTNFIATGDYTNWLSVSSTNAIVDPSAAGTNYLALTNLSQGSIRLYDLDYDQDYAVVVVGLDKAGNEGLANPSSWATNNTIKFAVTQGLMRTRAQIESAFPTNNNLRTGDKGAAGLFWIAAGPTNAQGGYLQVNKDYDLIYWDSATFNEYSNNVWSKVGTVRSNWFTDAEGQDYTRGTVRFYRASYKDRWQDTNVVTGLPQRPLASEEVYAMHNVVLSEGYNFVGLHGKPYTNTFLGVFGADTNFWPAGPSAAAGATKIEFYSSGTNAAVSSVYFFGTDGNWYLSGNPTPVTTNLQASNFFLRGFSITLPTPLPTNYVTTTGTDVAQPGTNLAAMVWHPVLQVPTNGPDGGNYTHVIQTGQGRPTKALAYNVVALNLPVSVHPSQMRLIESGFTKGAAGTSDEIYTINTSTKGVLNSSTIYCDASGVWRFVTGNGVVPAGFFKPNDVIVIVSRNGGIGNSWTWTYSPTNFYALPTRWMGQ